MAKCNLCNQKLGRITETHLWYKRKIHFSRFMRLFPEANIGPMPWNKGQTKGDNLSPLRLSNTLKTKKEWNFSKWQRERRGQQAIQYKKLVKNENLAELMGIILGDGNLCKHARTENLRVICNSKDVSYIRHIVGLITKIFDKIPSVIKRKNENATVVCLYQCKISKRLGLPCGNKIRNNVGIPHWIFLNKDYMRKCLKGLFETDGCFHEDRQNYTRCIEFKNNCVRLKKDAYNNRPTIPGLQPGAVKGCEAKPAKAGGAKGNVLFKGLKPRALARGVFIVLLRLGFNPQCGSNYVRLARKNEVYRFKELIDFRNYN